jgi:hypothetical protein
VGERELLYTDGKNVHEYKHYENNMEDPKKTKNRTEK